VSAGRSLAGLLCLLQLAACGQPLRDAVSTGLFQCTSFPAMGSAVGGATQPIDYRACFIRTRESPGSNWVADGTWWALQGGHFRADLSAQVEAAGARFYLNNTGGQQLKTILPAGEICETGYLSSTPPGTGNLASGKPFTRALLPFVNSVVLVTMKASLLRQVLERAFAQAVNPKGDALSFPSADGSLLAFSGNLRLVVDFTDYQNRSQLFVYPHTVRPGRLIQGATLDGAPLDLDSDAPITFASNAFVAGVDVASGQVKGKPGTGGGVAAGFYSDAFAVDGNQFVLLDPGKDPAMPDTLTETSAVARYFASFPTVAPQVDGRMTLLALSGPQAVDLCQ
jgi:hypothetical protein